MSASTVWRIAAVVAVGAAVLAFAACSDDPPKESGNGGETPSADDGPVEPTSSGGASEVDEPLASFPPDDSKKFGVLARRAGLKMVAATEAPIEPLATEDRGLLLLYPRGKVRPTDLDLYRIDTDYALKGTLRFERDGTTFFEQDLETDELVTEKLLPLDVRSAVKTGDHVVWSFRPEHGETRSAEFDVVDYDPSKAIEAATKRIDPGATLLRRQMTAQVLFEVGLRLAAYREARAVAEEAKSRPAWRIAQASLKAMGADKSRLGDETRDALSKLAAERGTTRHARDK